MCESIEITVLPQYYGAVIFLTQNGGVKVHFERNYMYFVHYSFQIMDFLNLKMCISGTVPGTCISILCV